MPSGTQEERETKEFKDERVEQQNKSAVAFVCTMCSFCFGMFLGQKERFANQYCARQRRPSLQPAVQHANRETHFGTVGISVQPSGESLQDAYTISTT